MYKLRPFKIVFPSSLYAAWMVRKFSGYWGQIISSDCVGFSDFGTSNIFYREDIGRFREIEEPTAMKASCGRRTINDEGLFSGCSVA